MPTEAERIRELEAENERAWNVAKRWKYEATDPTLMSPDEADFWERVEAEYP